MCVCFQDAVFLPTRSSFYTTFLRNCGRGLAFGITTGLRTEVWGNQWLTAFQNISLERSSLLWLSNVLELLGL